MVNIKIVKNQYAKDMKEFGPPVLFRLNNEMNGDWCIYSSYFTSNDTELYKAVWRYIYHIFQANDMIMPFGCEILTTSPSQTLARTTILPIILGINM